MAFEHWNSLLDEQKAAIINQAKESYENTKESACFWCGAKFTISGGYDKNCGGLLICKGECKQRRYFDNPANIPLLDAPQASV